MASLTLQDWITIYSRNLGIGNPGAAAQAAVSSALSSVACPSQYGAIILLPYVHALVSHWQGSDSYNALYQSAARFGLASLEYLAEVQVNGLDDTYLEFLRNALGGGESRVAREFLRRMGWAMWMANATISDILSRHLSYAASYTLPDLRKAKVREVAGSHYEAVIGVVRNAAALVDEPLAVNPRLEYLEEYDLSRILDEARHIQRKFGNLASG